MDKTYSIYFEFDRETVKKFSKDFIMECYKDGLKEEYKETRRNLAKLHKFLNKIEMDKNAKNISKCPISVWEEQAYHLGEYLKCLELRAEYDDIDLWD